MFVQDNHKWVERRGGGVVTKNKMDNPSFIDEADIPLILDEDYDDYNTLNAS